MTEPPDCTLVDWDVIERFSASQGGVREFLIGEVHGHPRYADGTRVRSGPVVWREGDRALTASGTLYRLAARAAA